MLDRRISSAGLFALVTLGAPLAAHAQERLDLELFGNERLYRTTLQPKHGDTQAVRGALFAGLDVSTMRGPGIRGWRPLAAAAGLDLGLYGSPMRFLQLSASGVAPMPVSPDGSQSEMRVRDLEGQAQLRAAVGTSNLDKGKLGGDVEVEAKILHTGPYSTSFLRRDVGPVPFWEGWAKATLWPRIGLGGDGAAVAPLSYTIRRLGYGDQTTNAGPAGKLESHRLAAGMGFKPYSGEFAHGWIQILGLAWDKTHIEPSRGAGARPRTIERIDLDVMRMDSLVAAADRTTDFNVSTALGGSWLWDVDTGEQVSTFTFTMASSVRGYLDRDRDRDKGSVGAAMGLSRRAGVLADGSALTRGWRLEGKVDVDLPQYRTGGAFRWASEQLTKQLAGDERKDARFLHAIATEWYVSVLPGLQVGAHHLSTQRCMAPWGPSASAPADVAFCHQLGGFVRLAESFAVARDKPCSKAARPRD